jgi:hypothetical protein
MPGAWPAGWDNRAAWEAVGGAWIRLARKEELVRELAVADAPARARLLHALRALSDALTLLHGEDAVRAIGTALRSGDLAHAADAGNAAAAAERLGAPALARAVALNAAAGWPEPPPLRTLFDQLAHGEPLAAEHVHEALGIEELLDEPEEHPGLMHARELVAHPKGRRDAAHELLVRRACA